MTNLSDPLLEALVVVERDGVHRIEIREVLQQGDTDLVNFSLRV